MSNVELRTHVFLDSMQPQFACYVATTSRGFLPVAHQASLFVEVSPGIEINRVTDIALKQNDVQPGLQVVERSFGLLEIHSDSQTEVLSAGQHILSALGLEENARLRPRILSSQVITNVTHFQAQLINRFRYGNMLLGGQTLYVLEVHPAGYATLAANEAEKAADVSLIEMQPFGAFGRLYLGGSEADIEEARKALHLALEGVSGRENKETKAS